MALSEKELIFNLALGQAGDYVIKEGQTNTKEYLTCDRFYENARKRVLKSHPWNESVKRVIIAHEEFGPIFEFDNQYALPTDHLKILSISTNGIDFVLWEVESGYIKTDQAETPQEWASGNDYTAGEYVNKSDVTYLCSVSNTASSANAPDVDAGTWTSLTTSRGIIFVRYIWNNDDPSTYSEDLKNAVAIQLAILISPNLQNDIKTKNALIQQNEQLTLPKARSVDAQEGKPRRFYNSRWNRSRNSFNRNSR